MLASLLLSPLLGFLINAIRFQSSNKKISGWIGTGFCFLSFLISCFYFFNYTGESITFQFFPWIVVGDLQIPFSFVLDSLSLCMVLLITGVGSFIHLYSIGYMSEDQGITKYFAYLNLFVFMMLVLVLADSLPLLFVGWEGVGLCSYLLIGFWFEDFKKVQAGMKAFLVNRVGDAFFLLGMFLLFMHFGSLEFTKINAIFESGGALPWFHPGALGALFLFLGATGKSAQAPLYIWLADAMAGPTPVSALIHAATMVTAGIYMIVRLFAFYSAFPDILTLIAWIAAITSLGAALIATRQWDFKKILAYSTISQLGYMFIAVGVKAFPAGIFHLLTHGCFKALLFLCAGSVIHGLSGQQDIRNMGNLASKLPITFFAFMIGALSLIALPPFSGFFSKDEILFSLFSSKHYGLWTMAMLTAACTTFYMTRLSFYVFFGKSNFQGSPHESPMIMWIPLVVLSILSIGLGFIGIPHAISEVLPMHPPHFLHNFLKPFSVEYFKGSASLEWTLMAASVVPSLVIILGSFWYYNKKQKAQNSGMIASRVLEKAFYVDDLLKNYLYTPFTNLAKICFGSIEKVLLLGGVVWATDQVLVVRKQLVKLQDGNFQSYALYFVIGMCVCLFLVFIK